jgi:hypothetical protein
MRSCRSIRRRIKTADQEGNFFFHAPTMAPLRIIQSSQNPQLIPSRLSESVEARKKGRTLRGL